MPEPVAKRAVDCGETTVRSRAEKSIFERIHVGSHVLEGTWRLSASWPHGEIWQAAGRKTAKAGSQGQKRRSRKTVPVASSRQGGKQGGGRGGQSSVTCPAADPPASIASMFLLVLSLLSTPLTMLILDRVCGKPVVCTISCHGYSRLSGMAWSGSDGSCEFQFLASSVFQGSGIFSASRINSQEPSSCRVHPTWWKVIKETSD